MGFLHTYILPLIHGPSTGANILQSSSPDTAAPAPQDSSEEEQSVRRLRELLDAAGGSAVALTGAGLSTDSGIPDYRGPRGSYSRGHKPMTHDEFLSSERNRKRFVEEGTQRAGKSSEIASWVLSAAAAAAAAAVAAAEAAAAAAHACYSRTTPGTEAGPQRPEKCRGERWLHGISKSQRTRFLLMVAGTGLDPRSGGTASAGPARMPHTSRSPGLKRPGRLAASSRRFDHVGAGSTSLAVCPVQSCVDVRCRRRSRLQTHGQMAVDRM